LASGVVLEIGVGSGLNVPFYTSSVRRLYALEPSEEMRRMAARRADGARFPVEFLAASAENIPLPAASVDVVATTWTLCTIEDAGRALQGFRRGRRPGGGGIFVGARRAPGV